MFVSKTVLLVVSFCPLVLHLAMYVFSISLFRFTLTLFLHLFSHSVRQADISKYFFLISEMVHQIDSIPLSTPHTKLTSHTKSTSFDANVTWWDVRRHKRSRRHMIQTSQDETLDVTRCWRYTMRRYMTRRHLKLTSHSVDVILKTIHNTDIGWGTRR